MIDREKVVERLTGLKELLKFQKDILGYGSFIEDINDALALLEEQEAVEPIITPWATDEDGNIVVAKKECGKCGYQFFTERPNFCENCGTPLLWEGR